MATELAAAYVTIIPSLKGAQKTIQKQLSGVDTVSAGRRVGHGFSTQLAKGMRTQLIGQRLQSVGKQVSAIGSGITNRITKPAVGAAAAVGGIAAALGFKRLVAIDTARGQFKGLGHDANAVMKQVDAGVTNTALSMAEGASLAVGILATGNLPLKELEGQIKRVANVSAAYGVEGAHTGYLLNNVLTKNKVTYGDLSQMVQNQIPIISMLAKHYGVAADEIEKMAQDGKISIKDFNEVLDKNAGAAASEYAKTWKGITSNIKSNIGKLGAKVLEEAFPKLKNQLSDFLSWLKSEDVNDWAEKAGKALGETFDNVAERIKKLKAQWDGLSKDQRSTILKLAGLAVVLGPALQVVGGIATHAGSLFLTLSALSTGGTIGGIALGLLKVLGAVGVVAGGFALLWQNSEDFRKSVQDAGAALAPVFLQLWEDLKPVAEELKTNLGPAVESLGKSIGDMVTAAVPMIAQMALTFADVMKVVGPLLSIILKALVPAFESAGKVISTVFGTIGSVLSTVRKHWETVVGGVKALVNGDWSGAWKIAKSFVSSNIGTMGAILGGFGRSLGTIFLAPIKAIVAATGRSWESIVTAAKTSFGKIRETVSTAIGRAVDVVREAPGRFAAAIPAPAQVLLGVGAKIIGGLKAGLESKFGEIRASLQGLTDKLPSWKGPAKRDKTLLTPAGRKVISGFVKGLESGYSGVRASLKKFTDDIAKVQEQAVKKETDRLVAARRKQNERLKKEGKKSLGALSRADAEKQAKKNVGIEAAALKKANKLIADQGKTTGVSARGVLDILNAKGPKGNSLMAKAARAQLRNQKNSLTLADIGKAQDWVQKSLTAAKDALQKMKDARQQLKEQVASSIKGELDLTKSIIPAVEDTVEIIQKSDGKGNIWHEKRNVKGSAAKATFASVAGNVKAMAAKAKAFAGKLAALVKKGIPQGLVQEVASLGTEEGSAIADALLSGTSAQVKALSADYAALNTWSNKAGDYVAGQMYDTGIYAQQGLIKGLEKDATKLDAAAKKLADRLTAAVKKELGIKSPSRVFRDEVGVQISRGVQVGLEREQSALDAALLAMVPDAGVDVGLSPAVVGQPAIYVQNPFTGEYLLSRVADVADSRVGALVGAAARGY